MILIYDFEINKTKRKMPERPTTPLPLDVLFCHVFAFKYRQNISCHHAHASTSETRNKMIIYVLMHTNRSQGRRGK